MIVNEKKVLERIKVLKEELAKAELTKISMRGGLIELENLLKVKK